MVLLAIAGLIAIASIAYSVSRDAAPASGAESAAGGAAGDVSRPLSIENLERQLDAEPGNGALWQQLGFAHFEQGNFAQAVQAYDRATAISPQNPVLWSSLGEARVMASERDPMPAAALAAFEKALALDAKDPRARYFMAVKKDLAEDHAGAIADWLALLEDTPAGAPWEEDLRRTIEQVGKINNIAVADRIAAVRPPAIDMPVAARGIPGPSAEDFQAASKIPPSEQADMANAMVARLEQRLKSEPTNVDGWVMLMRSRMTLGEADKASAALRQAIAANPGQADRLRQEASVLRVP